MSGQKQHLKLKQTQALTLTPQLEKSLKILQYNQQELELAVAEMLTHNVMLTTKEEIAFEPLDTDEDYHYDDTAAIDEDIPEQINADIEWETIYDSESEISLTASDSYLDESRYTVSESFDQRLENAIYMAFAHTQDLTLATQILSHLDEHYFLSQTPEQLAKQYQVDLQRINNTIDIIKHLEPAGVASQTIQECLLAQLHNLNNYDNHVANAHEILTDYYLYIEQKPQFIMRRLDLSKTQYEAAMAVIQELSPYPRIADRAVTKGVIWPDVYVHERMGIFYASLNADARFDIQINEAYAALAKQCKGDEKRFVTNQLKDAKFFIRALDQRNQTILRITNVIVMHQQAYFHSGDIAMKPLSMQEAAQLLQLHESTISRAVNGKYLSFNQRLIELRYFFSKQLPQSDNTDANTDNLSVHAIKARIKALVEKEDPQKPLSDTQIEKILKDEAIDISRRTVSKYRDQLGILKTSKRKQRN